ncbi:MAG TPA: hypothetical protein VFX51_29290 [Solirubrobacteraceae bacterium]|nr:hypothetical protein [Solirubrobacteraceae bacterium]
MWSRARLPLRDSAIELTDVTDHRSLTVAEHFDGPYWGPYDCFSEVVSFSARAD